jgi:hypothetical protein
MAIESWEDDLGKISFGSHSSLLAITSLDSQRSVGEGKKNMLQVSMGRCSRSFCPPLGKMESVGSSHIVGGLEFKKHLPLPKSLGYKNLLETTNDV